MKVFSISDLHLSLCGEKPMEIFEGWDNYLESIRASWLDVVSEDDIVVMAGDISWAMRLEEFEKDLVFFDDLPGKKVIVRGNHDYWWSSLAKVKAALPKDFFAIQNNCIRIGDYLFAGTRGWLVPERNMTLKEEDQKILDREIIRADLSLSQMNSLRQDGDKVIFVMHFPPFDSQRTFKGFSELFEKYNVDIVIYGHLHGKNVRALKFENRQGVKYFLTSTDQVGHKLVSICE